MVLDVPAKFLVYSPKNKKNITVSSWTKNEKFLCHHFLDHNSSASWTKNFRLGSISMELTLQESAEFKSLTFYSFPKKMLFDPFTEGFSK